MSNEIVIATHKIHPERAGSGWLKPFGMYGLVGFLLQQSERGGFVGDQGGN